MSACADAAPPLLWSTDLEKTFEEIKKGFTNALQLYKSAISCQPQTFGTLVILFLILGTSR